MTKYSSLVHLPNHEPTRQGANDLLLVLGVAAFVLGVAMLSRGVLPSQPAAHLVPTAPAVLGRVESLVPAWDERPAATTPPADRVPPSPVTSTASSGGTPVVAICPPRRALECDLRLGIMQMALQQRGLFLGRPVAPYAQDIPRKYCVLAHSEVSAASAAASPPDAPQAIDPGC